MWKNLYTFPLINYPTVLNIYKIQDGNFDINREEKE